MLVYLQIAQRLRPRWLLWENVPGVLSANGGRDFGALLGGLSELGYGWAYRVLDCQYVRTRRFPRAIPQRRRRVFLVAHCLERSAGDWLRPSKVLFDPESLSGHLAPQRKARQGVAPDAPRRAGAVREWDERQVSATVCSKWKHGGGPAGNEYHNLTVARWWDGSDVAPTILRKTHEQNMPDIGQFGALLQPTKAIAFKPGASAQAHSIGAQEGVACTLEAGGGGNNKQAVAFDWQSGGDSRGLDPKDTAQLQRCQPPAVVHIVNGNSTPETALELAFPLRANDGSGNRQAVAFTRCDNGRDASVEVTPTMRCGSNYSAHPAVAQSMSVRRLTPTECERLQGFPDGYTAIPWRRKPADQCPDGPRYKALGNSMATNCMEWIGERIRLIDSGGA